MGTAVLWLGTGKLKIVCVRVYRVSLCRIVKSGPTGQGGMSRTGSGICVVGVTRRVGTSLGIGSQALTWLWHRPLFALKQAAGCRQLANTCPVHGPGSELIEMAFMEVGDLQRWEVRLCKPRLGQRTGKDSGTARAGNP